MIDVMTGLTAAKQAFDIAQGLRALDKAYDAVEIKSKVIDLMDKLQDVRGALQDARDNIVAKDEELGRLKSLLDERQATVMHNGYRYNPDPDDPAKPMGYPFCPRCDEVDHRLIRCVDTPKASGAVCPQCKAEYGRGATRYLWKDGPSMEAVAAVERAEQPLGPRVDDGAYVFDDSGSHYCTGCYDAHGRKSLVSELKPPFSVFGKWSCPVCKQTTGSGRG